MIRLYRRGGYYDPSHLSSPGPSTARAVPLLPSPLALLEDRPSYGKGGGARRGGMGWQTERINTGREWEEAKITGRCEETVRPTWTEGRVGRGWNGITDVKKAEKGFLWTRKAVIR
jgi:hypothetical protein